MSRGYKFHNPEDLYFVSFAVVEWLDVLLTRKVYKDILLDNLFFCQKINYIHQNSVEERLVFKPEDYLYSNAVDYAGEKGLLDDIVIF